VDRLQWNSFDWLLSDGDLINVTIEHQVVGGDAVEFALEAGPLITWWKAILLPGNRWIWTQDARNRDIAIVPKSELHGDMQFGKAKFAGLHQGVYLLDSLEQLQGGDRVTFTWLRDGAPWRNDNWLQALNIDAPMIQGRGYWVRPGSQFGATVAVTNRGDPWYPGARYKLGSQDPQDNETWGLGRVELDSFLADVGPYPAGRQINFTATAPAVEGEYAFSWRMVQEGVQWFGGTASFKVVVAATQPAPISPPPPPPPQESHPPPPPPPPPTSGDFTVSMAQTRDPRVPAAWYIYTGMAYDPALHTLSNRAPAIIDSVKNIGHYSFTLFHRDRFGNQSLPLNFDPNASVSVGFQGMEVEGDWIAEFIGMEAEAPSDLVVSVHWHD
jgi:hypothetical protein